MKRFIAIVYSALILLTSLAAQATSHTLTVVNGANQSARSTTFFAQPVTVRLTDDGNNGAAVPDEHVYFYANTSAPAPGFVPGLVFFPGPDASTETAFQVVTDTNGYASIDVVGWYLDGPAMITADAEYASPVDVPLAVTSGGMTRVDAVSGSKQSATVDTAYALPWVAQAFDSQGLVVPDAAIYFASLPDVDSLGNVYASVTWGNGYHKVWVRANANGIAVSPVLTANNIAGREEGYASGLPEAGAAIYAGVFAYHNLQVTGGGGAGGGGRTVGVCEKPQDNNKDGQKQRIPDNNCGNH